jgi:hypothetical protein
MRHRLYLSPGMFGFGRLGSFNYFAHVERELISRFRAAGHDLVTHAIDDLPTASVRRRAHRLAEIVSQTSAGDPVHLLGHSTGGLDARLVASPATRSIAAPSLAWLPRLRSVTMMNTPHFGTPLAAFFTTANGQRALEALSILTVTGLSLGAQPLAATSAVLGFLRSVDRVFPFKLRMLELSIDSMVGLVDDARHPSVREFLRGIQDDQGSMMQLSPESMDLVSAGFDDRPGVVYQSTVAMAPSSVARRWRQTVGHPWRSVSASVFVAIQRLTAGFNPRYPCAATRDGSPWAGDATEALLARVYGTAPPLEANDGVVPLRSQLWGNVVWAGLGDHLDVLGHYGDGRDPAAVDPALRHRDWLFSGSNFGDAEMTTLMDTIAAGMLGAAG